MLFYHIHSDYSVSDSATDYKEYVDKVKELGHTAIASTEHGKPLGWITKKMYCDSTGIKFIHGVEIYLTEKLEPKIRDNYHTVLLARNLEGVMELNRLVTLSTDEEHFYYTNRISFEEFLQISDNIISTSACLASPLNKLPEDHPMYMKLAEKYTFLEIQPHIDNEQAKFNKRLYWLSKLLNKPLIAGTDTHSATKYKAECRMVLLGAKQQSYGNEDNFDLTMRTYDEYLQSFERQNALPYKVYKRALDNTNLLDEMTDNWDLDKTIKYPILYGTREKDSEMFVKTVNEKFQDKLYRGVIPVEQKVAFEQALAEEIRVFQKLKMDGFMLSMSELISWCKEQGFAIGPSRGSVGGSRVAYVTDIIGLNPETWHTVFSRFCNEDREEVGDIDIDCCEEDRPKIFDYIRNRFGVSKTARVLSFTTIQDKKAIEEAGRYFKFKWQKEHPDKSEKDNPYIPDNIKKIKKLYTENPEKAKKDYKEIFYFYEGLQNVKNAVSVHPAGIVISPVTLEDNYGMFLKDNDYCLLLDMDEVHDIGLVKYDFLVLKTIAVIRDTCSYIGIPYPKFDEVDWSVTEVWEDLIKFPEAIFQFENEFAFNCLKKFRPKNIFDMCLVTAALRPSGASYRNDLLSKITHYNPSPIIDEILKDNNGYLVYQEDVIKFLQQICGFSGSEADNIRRAIGRKDKERLDKAIPRILSGYCEKSDKPRAEAEKEARDFLKIIEDASSYMFGYNHSVGYCLLSYLCAYYRYFYPKEFISAFLNNAANDDDFENGASLAIKKKLNIINPKAGISKSKYFITEDSIVKGLSSYKGVGESLGDEMYELFKSKHYEYFTDIIVDATSNTSIKKNLIEVLIKTDYFSDYGNQRELLRINDILQVLKYGRAKSIKKEYVEANLPITLDYGVGTTKSGKQSASVRITEMKGLLHRCEDEIKALNLEDLSPVLKWQNFKDYAGYPGYVSGREQDRSLLYIKSLYPLKRKKDGKQFGYSVITKSIGSGIESRFTVWNKVFDAAPIKEGEIIRCKSYERDSKGYFTLKGYEKYE